MTRWTRCWYNCKAYHLQLHFALPLSICGPNRYQEHEISFLNLAVLKLRGWRKWSLALRRFLVSSSPEVLGGEVDKLGLSLVHLEWGQSLSACEQIDWNHFVLIPGSKQILLSSPHPLFSYSRPVIGAPGSRTCTFCLTLWTWGLRVAVLGSALRSPPCLPAVSPQSCSLMACSSTVWGSKDSALCPVHSAHLRISGTEGRGRWKNPGGSGRPSFSHPPSTSDCEQQYPLPFSIVQIVAQRGLAKAHTEPLSHFSSPGTSSHQFKK